MQVRDVMSTSVVLLYPDDSVGVADAIMRESGVRHMPVVDRASGALVGLVSRHDLFRRAIKAVAGSSACQEAWRVEGLPVSNVMTTSVVVTSEGEPLSSAARTLRERNIGCLPVVSGREVVGILSESDFVALAAGVETDQQQADAQTRPNQEPLDEENPVTELRTILHDEVEELRAARDELRVRLHLGRAEVRDQWEKLEKSLQHAEAKARVLREASAETAEEIAAAARLLLEEVREGYGHLRRLL